ncbi:hypothetical protein QCA50_020357 [Cerrena zonata]|uniref:Uncharacterized protein n=1 Tax=Cerrena zonata TaxID=2478898 RepID=A0AAW0FJ59_9APHY
MRRTQLDSTPNYRTNSAHVGIVVQKRILAIIVIVDIEGCRAPRTIRVSMSQLQSEYTMRILNHLEMIGLKKQEGAVLFLIVYLHIYIAALPHRAYGHRASPHHTLFLVLMAYKNTIRSFGPLLAKILVSEDRMESLDRLYSPLMDPERPPHAGMCRQISFDTATRPRLEALLEVSAHTLFPQNIHAAGRHLYPYQMMSHFASSRMGIFRLPITHHVTHVF